MSADATRRSSVRRNGQGLDDTDRAIIEQLQRDGRLPYTRLASAVSPRVLRHAGPTDAVRRALAGYLSGATRTLDVRQQSFGIGADTVQTPACAARIDDARTDADYT